MTPAKNDVEQRLERLEHKMSRIIELLEKRPAQLEAAPHPLDGAVDDAARALSDAFGAEATREHLGQLLARLAEPDTAEALVRIAELSPQLELGLHAVAASPQLLEEAIGLAKRRLTGALDPATAERRVELGVELVERLSGEAELGGLRELAELLPALTPFLRGGRQALEARAAADGEGQVAENAADLLLRLTDPETTGSLLRLAELAPQLEYAAHFAAAGPVLLEDALDMVREQTRRAGIDARPEQLLELAQALGAPRTLELLTRLVRDLGPLEPALAGATRALAAHAAVEGAGQVEARVAQAVQDILDPETLDALVRLANLAPQLEYAAQFVAAGPALLEDGMAAVQKTMSARLSGAPVEARVERALELLLTATEPRRLEALERLVARVETLEPLAAAASSLDGEVVAGLAGALSDKQTADGVRRLLELAPTLAAPLEALPIQARTLDILRTLNQAVEDASTQSAPMGAFGLFAALGETEVKRAAGFGVGVARRLGKHLDAPPRLDRGASNGHQLDRGQGD